MFTLLRSSAVILCGLVLLTSRAWAAGSTLEGIVKDANGAPLPGAQIRIEGKDGAVVGALKTDAKGHYSQSGLGPGTYHVTLIVNGETKAVIANVEPRGGETEKLNFDLQKGKAVRPFAKGKHYVLVRDVTGTHLAHWIEVDDEGKMSVGMQERYRWQANKQAKTWQDAGSGMRNQ
jgi:hypothetical protein